MTAMDLTTCDLCKREAIKLTEHHLIPREMGGKNSQTVLLCTTCHKQIHALFTNKELAFYLNTIERLKEDEKVMKYLNWVERQPSTTEFTIKKSKHVRKKHKNRY